MKWDVKLFVAGSMFVEQVHATNMQDARQTALARNPTARIVSVTVTFKKPHYKLSLTLLTEIAIGFIILLFAKCHD